MFIKSIDLKLKKRDDESQVVEIKALPISNDINIFCSAILFLLLIYPFFFIEKLICHFPSE
jgi:hypothetical protein